MSREPPVSALRLVLRPGEWVQWDARAHRLESICGAFARVRDPTSNEVREVPVGEIRGLPHLSGRELDARVDQVRVADPKSWDLARIRESTVRAALAAPGNRKDQFAHAAAVLGVSVRTVFRLAARYGVSAQTTSLLPRRRGPPPSARRLSATCEHLIAEAIERRFLIRPKTPMEEVYRSVVHRCREEALAPPSRNSVLARIRAMDVRQVARRRLGAKGAQAIALSTPGSLQVKRALERIQIDHTLADVIIVDSQDRLPIGRPWLSVAIDVATRCVLGFHIALEAPCALSVALCLEHACLPKEPPPGSTEPELSWPMFGLPECIHVDNGAEFHGAALVRGCEEYGIRLEYRPVGRPQYGGHIERLIGTLMGRVHLLPGTTDASPSHRDSYPSEREARLTLAEFREWLTVEVARYHNSLHRMLGSTPAAAWTCSLNAGVAPAIPADPRRFILSFLPLMRRRLQRNGLLFERLRYWADVLPKIAQPRESLIVRYDPRNLSVIWILGRDQHYHAVPYADLTHPPISLAELRHLAATLHRQAHHHINEAQLFALFTRQQQIVSTATHRTLSARRSAEKLKHHPATAVPARTGVIDYSHDPTPLPSEIWEKLL